MTHGSLFSGIGGFDLAATWMGWENKFHCEINKFGQVVLKYYWPDAELYENIKTTDFRKWKGLIDVLTGGFPCQPFSVAGGQLGTEDPRHLWPEYLRAIQQIEPAWVVGENVRGLVSWNAGLVFDQIQTDLETEGYEVLPFLLPACAVNAPHKRERIWFVAYSKIRDDKRKQREISSSQRGSELNDLPALAQSGDRLRRERIIANSVRSNDIRKKSTSDDSPGRIPEQYRPKNSASGEFDRAIKNDAERSSGNRYANASNANSGQRLERRLHPTRPDPTKRHVSPFDAREARQDWKDFPLEPPLCDGNDGLPGELDGITFSKWRTESLKAGGNAIVPQVVYPIFKSIEIYDQWHSINV